MILVTGGTGHIGNVLVRELIRRGETVRVLVLPDEDCSSLNDVQVEIVEGDILIPESLEKAVEGVEVIYHLAGMISILPEKSNLVHRINVEGTRNVLRAAKLGKIRRLIYTSSIHALGRPPHGITIDESIPFDPISSEGAYDRSKAEASLAVLEAATEGMDAVIVCPTGVIGPYDFRGSRMGTLILDAIKSKLQFWVEGAYDFVDVRDVAHGMILACQKGKAGESYILGGERISVKGIYDVINEITGKHSLRLKIPGWFARFAAKCALVYYDISRSQPLFTPYSLATLTSNSYVSWNKAKIHLGYHPRPLKVSISDTIHWLKTRTLG
ncbi:MAG: NAD-dependent epimerase/dehydratase family protein [Chloroflexi bacterium]|nr:MAG: NAD-dependent epimerase/dehydratase family protein [Chloroflexota bacterium]